PRSGLLSLHDALPIFRGCRCCHPRTNGETRRPVKRPVIARISCSGRSVGGLRGICMTFEKEWAELRAAAADRTATQINSGPADGDRKSTRLNSNHVKI